MTDSNPSSEQRPDSSSTDDTGFIIKKQRRWPIFAGVGIVVVLIAAFFITRDGDDKSEALADTSKPVVVSTFGANVAEVELIDYIDQEIAPKYGIDLEFRDISDSTQLNRAVSEGEVGGTIYQHKFWLDQVLEANPDFNEEVAAEVFRWGFGIWSTKHDDVSEIPDGGTVTLPADPANEAYALFALDAAGLITLKEGTKPELATQDDIDENPKNLEFKLIEYTAQARTLDDVDAAVGYTEVFIIAEIDPSHEIFAAPTPDAFIGQLTIGSDFADTESIKKLVEAFKDPAIQEYLKTGQDDLPYGLLPLES